jgi:hypothetical protein
MSRNGEKVFKTIFALTETERKIWRTPILCTTFN